MKNLQFSGYIYVIMLSICLGCKTKGTIFYVNSYHEGYSPSDSITNGIYSVLGNSFHIKKFCLNAKHTDPENISTQSGEIYKLIKKSKPDVVMVSDDDAVKYLVVPFLKGTGQPVVFCGVNWSASSYNLPSSHIVGIVEILPLQEVLSMLRMKFPHAKKLTILSENTLSEQRNKTLLDTLYRMNGLEPKYVLVNSFFEWQQEFRDANFSADIIYLPTVGGVKGWNDSSAQKFVMDNIQKPVFTCDDFMMPYSVFGLTKVAKEQGEWAAITAKEIFEGKDISSIQNTQNTQVRGYLNLTLAKQIGFEPDHDLLQTYLPKQFINSSIQ